MTTKRVVIGIVIVLLLWCALFAVDYTAVTVLDCPPVFCMESHGHHYNGLGYSYDAYKHPLNGEFQYSLNIFGINVKSTITD